jgi:hypothetical protein
VGEDHFKGTNSTKLVLLPGFQKGRDIKVSQGKGQGAVLTKKGQFVRYKEKLEKQISLLLGSIKCFPISFNTFMTL